VQLATLLSPHHPLLLGSQQALHHVGHRQQGKSDATAAPLTIGTDKQSVLGELEQLLRDFVHDMSKNEVASAPVCGA